MRESVDWRIEMTKFTFCCVGGLRQVPRATLSNSTVFFSFSLCEPSKGGFSLYTLCLDFHQAFPSFTVAFVAQT